MDELVWFGMFALVWFGLDELVWFDMDELVWFGIDELVWLAVLLPSWRVLAKYGTVLSPFPTRFQVSTTTSYVLYFSAIVHK